MNSSTFNSNNNFFNALKKSIGPRILVFSIIILSSIFGIKSALNLNKFGHILYDSRYFKSSLNSAVIAFGSSHIRYGLSPMGFHEKFSNLGTDGDNVLTMQQQIERWIDYDKHYNGDPKVILLEFDNIIFSRHVKGYGADQNLRRFYSKNLNYRDFKIYFPGFFEQATLAYNYYFDGFFFKPSDFVKKILGVKQRNTFPISESVDGETLDFITFKNPQLDGHWSRGVHDEQFLKSEKFVVLSEYYSAFEKIVESLQKAGHRVLLIRLPHMEGYYDFGHNKLKIRDDKINSFGMRILEKYNVEFLDYKKSSWIKDSHFFADGHHLIEEGAIKFSKEISSVLKNEVSILSKKN